MVREHYDLIIIGGGPVGMALSLALRESGMSVLLLESRELPEKAEDLRPLALSYGSHLILHRLGVWQALPEITPITKIHVSNRGGFGRAVLVGLANSVPFHHLQFSVFGHDDKHVAVHVDRSAQRHE